MAESDPNPSLKLSSVALNGLNYVPWSRAVTLSLGGKRKLGYTNGNSVCPDSKDPKYEDWIANDQLVRSWILNSMEPHIAEIFTFSNSSKELWDSISELYGSNNNSARVFELKCEIAVAEQGDKTFSEHLGYLKKLWDELNMYRPFTADPIVLQQRVEEDKNFSLLSSLKPEYENLRSNILMAPKLPSFSIVCQTIQREETRKKTMNADVKVTSEKLESHALVAEKNDRKEKYGKSNRNKGKREIYHCDHCGKNGHTKDRCWDLYPHLKTGPDKNKKDHAAVADTSISMNQLSHLLQQISKSMSSEISQTSSTNVSGNLQAYLTSSCNTNSWIIDSGVTDHMTNNPSLVHDFIPINHKHEVSIANGATVPISGNGKIKFFPQSSTSKVLVVPSFPVQLLSVGKITNSLNCDVIFSLSSVIFQDRKMRKTIGEGIYSHGLYLLNTTDKACHTKNEEGHILHKRLGHPSDRIL
ncbi:retrovirus-related pol polyprotein from transposon RE1 [Citrus sinensis]|nr:retrovirus-related pol polyprotein from transposon RE1 [Citrus sinensis]